MFRCIGTMRALGRSVRNCALENKKKNRRNNNGRDTVKISQMNFLGHGNIIMQIEFKCTRSRMLYRYTKFTCQRPIYAVALADIFHFFRFFAVFFF